MSKIILLSITMLLCCALSAQEKVWVGVDYTHKGGKGNYLFGEIDKSVWDKLKAGTYEGNTIYLSKTCWIEEGDSNEIKKPESKFYKNDLILFVRDVTQLYTLKGDPYKIAKELNESEQQEAAP